MTKAEYNTCVEQFSDGLFRFCLKYLKDSFEAENVVQNTFEKLWKRRKDVELKTAKAFMFRIAYNNSIDLLRKRGRSVQLEDHAENSHFHHEQYTGIREVIDKEVEKLPEKQKAVIMLRDYEGYDYRSIGKITGLTEAQVKINIFRARKFLKEQLKELRLVL
jgi:RNA polymerase sigma factor (sigma-70 family)